MVGAYALALHGAPRFTGDLDILVRPTEENAERLLLAIADFGFPVESLIPMQVIERDRLIEMGVPPIQIHVMSHIDGVTWQDVWASRVESRIGSADVAFIGREAFLRNKLAAGRPKDLADIEALRDV
ncbi:MAG: hypothetical protein QM736_09380 [Vicinamibacterales bacterium]